ncbi:RTA1 like protein [Vararia minispora EC-137]|uniref:RTA1 like protein n=1 Tax=Vararia minispora EC-137 TaxID=1314806 RepID=A0ACB8QSM4_9AGAM|nr:RTA1 like protein [Vararia minispora EC-137]
MDSVYHIKARLLIFFALWPSVLPFSLYLLYLLPGYDQCVINDPSSYGADHLLITSSEFGPNRTSLYGYDPSKVAAIIFLATFGLATLVHVFQAIRSRLWFLFPTAILCGIGELLGWGFRLYGGSHQLDRTAFTVQTAALIVSPTPLIAVCFVLLGRLVTLLGPQYSRLSARACMSPRITADVVCLLVQGIGGGRAAGSNTLSKAQTFGWVVFGGIVLQLVSLLLFTALAVEFLWRYLSDKPLRKSGSLAVHGPLSLRLRWLIHGMSIMLGLFLIRSLYRVVELSGGWGGPMLDVQWAFCVFDATMILLAMATLNVLHPGWLFLPEQKMAGRIEKSVG